MAFFSRGVATELFGPMLSQALENVLLAKSLAECCADPASPAYIGGLEGDELLEVLEDCHQTTLVVQQGLGATALQLQQAKPDNRRLHRLHEVAWMFVGSKASALAEFNQGFAHQLAGNENESSRHGARMAAHEHDAVLHKTELVRQIRQLAANDPKLHRLLGIPDELVVRVWGDLPFADKIPVSA